MQYVICTCLCSRLHKVQQLQSICMFHIAFSPALYHLCVYVPDNIQHCIDHRCFQLHCNCTLSVALSTNVFYYIPDYSKGQLDLCRKRADSCVDVLGRFTDDEVPNKNVLLSTLFSCLGNCDMQTKRYTSALENHGHDLLIGEQW